MSDGPQFNLFGPEPVTPPLPIGFCYQQSLLGVEEEAALLPHLAALPLKEFQFQGYVGKRRTMSFGWRYDFNERKLLEAEPIPPFLLPLRERAAAFAGLAADDFPHVLVTEYGPGVEIGWHKDKAVFDKVVGVSLGSACRFRFRRQKSDGKWERAELTLEPRSVYLLDGPSRTDWEHSIPPVDELRYSITLRTLR